MQLDLSIVIPAFNEAERITPTLRSVDAFLRDSDLRYEILVVDDGSSDDTVAVVDGLRGQIDGLRCIESKPNRGKGHAVRVGMLAARGHVRVMTDADGSVPAEQLPAIVNPIRLGHTDIAIGSRYTSGAAVEQKQPFYRVWWSRFANRVVQWTLIRGINDTQCGFKAFSAEAAEAVFRRATIDGWAFDLEALALATRLGYDVTEVGVYWSDDERSRINPLADALNVARELFTIRKNLRRNVYGELAPHVV